MQITLSSVKLSLTTEVSDLLDDLKDDLDITNGSRDSSINSAISLGTQNLLAFVSQWGSESDILNDQGTLEIAKETIRLNILSKFKKKVNNLEAAQSYFEEFKDMRESLIRKLQSNSTGISKRHFASTTYEEDLLRVHGQDFGLGELL